MGITPEVENRDDRPQTTRLVPDPFPAAVVIFCLVALLTYVILAYPEHRDPRTALDRMVEFTAYRPFVTRALLPMIARPLAVILPDALVEFGAINPALGRAMTALSDDHPAHALAVLIVMFAFLLAWVAGLRRLMRALHINRLSLDLLTLAAPWTLLAFVLYPQIYDLATLAVFTWALAILAEGNDDLYLVIFLLATIARETAILLIPLYWITRRQLPGVVMQLGLYGAIRSIILLYLVNNPGVTAEMHLVDFILRLSHPHAVPSTLLALSIGVAVLWRWPGKPLFLRHAFLVMIPALTVLHFLVGYPFEVRMFLEVWPVVMLLLLHPRAYERSEFSGSGLSAGHAAADPGSGVG